MLNTVNSSTAGAETRRKSASDANFPPCPSPKCQRQGQSHVGGVASLGYSDRRPAPLASAAPGLLHSAIRCGPTPTLPVGPLLRGTDRGGGLGGGGEGPDLAAEAPAEAALEATTPKAKTTTKATTRRAEATAKAPADAATRKPLYHIYTIIYQDTHNQPLHPNPKINYNSPYHQTHIPPPQLHSPTSLSLTPNRDVLLSVFAAVCLPVCANTAAPETRATVFATHTDTAVSVFATHHGAHLAPSWPQPATAGPRHPPASIPRSQAGQTGAGTGGTAGTASPAPDVVEVEPKERTMKWTPPRLMLLFAQIIPHQGRQHQGRPARQGRRELPPEKGVAGGDHRAAQARAGVQGRGVAGEPPVHHLHRPAPPQEERAPVDARQGAGRARAGGLRGHQGRGAH